MLTLADHIVETKTGDFDPSEFVDEYENAMVEMLKQKQAAGSPCYSSGFLGLILNVKTANASHTSQRNS
jgi:hypothetical protein